MTQMPSVRQDAPGSNKAHMPPMLPALPCFKQVIQRFRYHLYSIWLFTYSDIKTVIVPKTVFGTVIALAAPAFGLSISVTPSPLEVLRRIPITIFWLWINLLPLDISNQRLEESIAEDKLNKPWRVLPSGRMSSIQATALMCSTYTLAAITDWKIGGLPGGAALVVLGIWYNKFGGANNNCVIRNVLNGLGYISFATGATEVAFGSSMLPYRNVPFTFESALHPDNTEFVAFWKWIGMLVMIVSSTIHGQDLYDQDGDSIRHRRTIPLVIGDFPARITLVVTVTFWSIVCALYWNAGPVACTLIGVLGLMFSLRTLLFRSRQEDRMTFRVWNAWLTCIYMLPLLKMWNCNGCEARMTGSGSTLG